MTVITYLKIPCFENIRMLCWHTQYHDIPQLPGHNNNTNINNNECTEYQITIVSKSTHIVENTVWFAVKRNINVDVQFSIGNMT